MTRTALLLMALLLGAFPALASPPLTGTWTAEAHEDRLQLNLRGRERGMMGFGLPLSAFQGLSVPDGSAPFRLEREAGTVFFEGRFTAGEGAGHYRFEPHAAYAKDMAALGYTKLEPGQQFQLALFNVGPARVRELAALGYKDIPLETLIQVGIFHVTPEYIREMRDVGYADLPLEKLVELRIHAIDANFVRSLAGAGKRRR
jgi:hypothetical protein